MFGVSHQVLIVRIFNWRCKSLKLPLGYLFPLEHLLLIIYDLNSRFLDSFNYWLMDLLLYHFILKKHAVTILEPFYNFRFVKFRYDLKLYFVRVIHTGIVRLESGTGIRI